MKIFFILPFILLFLVSCNSDQEGFKLLEDIGQVIDDYKEKDKDVEILSVSPDVNPVVLTTLETKTFALQTNSGSGNVNFLFELDGFPVQDSSSPFFNLSAVGMDLGSHILKVTATNSISMDTHIFNVRKNSAPVINLTESSNGEISCINGEFSFDVSSLDPDGDDLSFNFLFNGAPNSSVLTSTVSSNTASVLFRANCSLVGSNTVTIRAIDSYGEYSDFSMGVTVTNPNVAKINSYSPTSQLTTIRSTESINFMVGATGAPPINYNWSIDPGSEITRCQDQPNCSISGADFTPGQFVLSININDATPTSDAHDFNIVINAKPEIITKSPSTSNLVRMNCGLSKNFEITVRDLNLDQIPADEGQQIDITWTLDNLPSNKISVYSNTLDHNFSSIATFSPNCADSLLGNHILKVTVTDGHEEVSTSWNIQTNYFSNFCNDMLNDNSEETNQSKGKICTLAGLPGLSSGVNPIQDPVNTKISPDFIAPYDSSTENAYFFSDSTSHVVWFYNGTNQSITVIGKVVEAGKLVALVGVGIAGLGTLGQIYNNYYLSSPQGVVYDKANDKLYIADYNNHRILVVDNTGAPQIFAGSGSSNVDDALNTSHRCNNPRSLIKHQDNIIANCYGNTTNTGNIKSFSITSGTGTSITRYIGNNSITEGSAGIGGSGGANRPYSIVKHPSKDVLFAVDWAGWCRVYAINFGLEAVDLDGLNITIPANYVKRITTSTGCGYTYNKLGNDSTLRLYPRGLSVRVNNNSGAFEGLYFAEYYHAITFMNLSAASITISGTEIQPGYVQRILGTGSAAYSRNSPLYSGTSVNTPWDITSIGSRTYFSDKGNGRISFFDSFVSASSFSSDHIGFNYQLGYDGIENKNTISHHLNLPTSIAYDKHKNRILFYDEGNRRIRSIDLVTGLMDVVVGNGNSGQITADPVLALHNSFRLRNIRDMYIFDDSESMIFLDSYTNYNVAGVLEPWGANQENCVARFWNYSDTSIGAYGYNVDPNYVKTIVGDRGYGCANWNSNYEGRLATDLAMNNIIGVIANDDDEIYISNYYNHCILKINPISNTVNEFMGQCGSPVDNIMGPFSLSRFRYPGDLERDSDPQMKANGNFFIVDRSFTTLSSIKYANFSNSTVTLANSDPIPPNNVGRLIITDGYTTNVTSFDNQICYNQGYGGNASTFVQNVICIDRVTGSETLRVGRSNASVVKGGVLPLYEGENINSSSALLRTPFGLTFDSEGNLYITERDQHTIRLVKRWF